MRDLLRVKDRKGRSQTSWVRLSPSTPGDSLHGTPVFSTNAAIGRYHTTKSTCVVFYLTHLGKGLWSAGCTSALSLWTDTSRACIPSPVTGYRRLMGTSHKDHQVLHQVPWGEPTSSKLFPEGASKQRCGSYGTWQKKLLRDTSTVSVVPTCVLSM